LSIESECVREGGVDTPNEGGQKLQYTLTKEGKLGIIIIHGGSCIRSRVQHQNINIMTMYLVQMFDPEREPSEEPSARPPYSATPNCPTI